MTYLAVFISLVIAGYFIRPYWLELKTKCCGIDTEGVVSLIEEETFEMKVGNNYGRGRYRYCYVRFQKIDGTETEAKLFNPKNQLAEGTRVKVRYLPGKESSAVITEILES